MDLVDEEYGVLFFLQGVSHPATRMEPYNSINLTWQNTSVQTQGYQLERSLTGMGSWVQLALTPPGTATSRRPGQPALMA